MTAYPPRATRTPDGIGTDGAIDKLADVAAKAIDLGIQAVDLAYRHTAGRNVLAERVPELTEFDTLDYQAPPSEGWLGTAAAIGAIGLSYVQPMVEAGAARLAETRPAQVLTSILESVGGFIESFDNPSGYEDRQ